jgi:hypothetical protein
VCCGPTGGSVVEEREGRNRTGPTPSAVKHPHHLVFDHIAKRAYNNERSRRIGCFRRHVRDQGCKEVVLALGEGGFDTRSRIGHHPAAGRMLAIQSAGGARQIELDDFRRAGSDQDQQLDFGTAGQKPRHHLVEFVIHVGHAGKIALVDDGGGESRLGEDHHAGGRLHEMSAGTRADDQEESILHLAMQPHDRGQAAEHFMLATLLEHVAGRFGGGVGTGSAGVKYCGHAEASMFEWEEASRRARRNFQRNCPALMTYET